MTLIDWTCKVCGSEYSLTEDILEREKKFHGIEVCGVSTTQQRVSINTVNIVRREGVRGETFAETLERLVTAGTARVA